MDSTEQELVRLVVELERMRQRRELLEQRCHELAGYLASVGQIPAPIRPAAPDWLDDRPVQSTQEWLAERDRDTTTNLRAERYRALSPLSKELPYCPPGCTREYEHQHYADGQVYSFDQGGR